MKHRVITDPAYWRMKKRLRQAQAELSAVPSLDGAPWSSAARWMQSQRKRLARRVDGLAEKVAAYRRKHGIEEPEPWRARAATRADAKIRRKFAGCRSMALA